MNAHTKIQTVNTLILGIGNLLFSDDGIGIHAANALNSMELPGDVEVLEVGSSFFDAINAIEKTDRIIILDAIKADGIPGSVYRIPMSEFSSSIFIDSMHCFDIINALEMSGNKNLEEVIVMGIEPAKIEWGLELSYEVAGSLPLLLEEVQKEIGVKRC